MSPSKLPIYIEDVVQPAMIKRRSFAKAYPEAALLWDYKRNRGWGPEDFSYGSSVRAWFKCPKGKDHHFQIALSVMGKAVISETWSMACGFCRGLRSSVTNNLEERFPALAREFMIRKNRIRPDQITFGSQKLVWWKCRKNHEWQASVANRTGNDSGCPKCNRGAPTDLRDFPEVLKEFDIDKNKGIDPHALPVGMKVSWICSVDKTHRWDSGFYRTSKRKRCPYCTNQKGSKGNNLKESHPQLARQWHPTQNGDIKPQDITEGSSFKAFWTCKKGPDHVWEAKVNDRVKDESGCPFCSYRKTSVTNVISTQAPHLVKEWHPKKNGKQLPSQERSRSRTLRWWICSTCSHEWTAEPQRRIVRGSGCPKCATRQSVKNMLQSRGIKKKITDINVE